MISPVTPSENIIPRSSLLPPHQDCGHSETVQHQPVRTAEQSGSRPSPGRMVSEPYLHKGQVSISLAAFKEAGDGHSMVLSSQTSTDTTFNCWYGNHDCRLFILFLTSVTSLI